MPRGAHLPDVATKESRAKGAYAANKARTEKRERLIALAEEKLENALERAVGVYVEGMEAKGSVVARDGDIHETDDHRTRISAADRVTDRILGKAIQRTELTGAGGGPVVLENDVSPDSARAILRGLAGQRSRGPGDAANGHAAPDEVHSS